MLRGARPIQSSKISRHYADFVYRAVDMDVYQKTWRRWLIESDDKSLTGLDDFGHADFVNGTSQCFDHFWARHRNLRSVTFVGEFQYHRCVNKVHGHKVITKVSDLREGDALILSIPFSDTGSVHAFFPEILQTCATKKIPVCLDLAYWGIAQNIRVDLVQFACVEEVTCSLSKPFHVLENHRVGIRFSRDYHDDGVSMINEVNMQNYYSMSLAIHFMDKFGCDWNMMEFGCKQKIICLDHDLTPTDTVIFGLGGDSYAEFNRGIPNNNRVCISDLLTDIT